MPESGGSAWKSCRRGVSEPADPPTPTITGAGSVEDAGTEAGGSEDSSGAGDVERCSPGDDFGRGVDSFESTVPRRRLLAVMDWRISEPEWWSGSPASGYEISGSGDGCGGGERAT